METSRREFLQFDALALAAALASMAACVRSPEFPKTEPKPKSYQEFLSWSKKIEKYLEKTYSDTIENLGQLEKEAVVIKKMAESPSISLAELQQIHLELLNLAGSLRRSERLCESSFAGLALNADSYILQNPDIADEQKNHITAWAKEILIPRMLNIQKMILEKAFTLEKLALEILIKIEAKKNQKLA